MLNTIRKEKFWQITCLSLLPVEQAKKKKSSKLEMVMSR